MSHFTVLVVGENPEEQLAPYQENNMGDCPKEYLEFRDVEDEYRKQYEEDTVEKVLMPDGRLLNSFDDELKVGKDFLDRKTVIPEGAKKKVMKFTELYKTFEAYMKDWCGFDKRDPKKKRYGYWENPNCKWDWHQLGGRWRGFFKLKRGADGTVGGPGVFDNEAEEGWADQVRKRDIDIQGMRDAAADKAAAQYDRLAELLGGEIPKVDIRWEKMLKSKGTIEEKREKYHAQPAFKKLEAARKRKGLSKEDQSLLVWADLEEYQGGREAFVGRAIQCALSTFAVVKDGKWYEKGEMGWFGCVKDEKETGKWESEFGKLLDEVPDETLLSVFDCHI